MFGNLVLSLISGVAATAGMYWAYGTARLKAQVGPNRLRASVTVGVAVPPRVVPQNTGVDCTATCGAGIPGMVALSITVSFLLSVRVRV